MLQPDTAKPISMFECELTVYRKGSLSVRINLEQGTMIWQESRQWCNNFVRGLSLDQTRELSQLIVAAERFSTVGTVTGSHENDRRDNLLLTIHQQDQHYCRTRNQLDTDGWNSLQRAIETLSRTPFRL